MNNKQELYKCINSIIENIDAHKDPRFEPEKQRRQEKQVTAFANINEIFKKCAYLIAYSQNAKSKLVDDIIQSGKLDQAFNGFDINDVINMNPCDIVDNHWDSIKGIRQKTKIFQIIMLARKLNNNFLNLFKKTGIPKTIVTQTDIDKFWVEFDLLQHELKINSIPFFQSTTSLLHLLLDLGYDCVKPDLVVMRVASQLGIVKNKTRDKDFREVVRAIQEYSLSQNIRPAVIDLYFLIEGGQSGAKKYVNSSFISYFPPK